MDPRVSRNGAIRWLAFEGVAKFLGGTSEVNAGAGRFPRAANHTAPDGKAAVVRAPQSIATISPSHITRAGGLAR